MHRDRGRIGAAAGSDRSSSRSRTGSEPDRIGTGPSRTGPSRPGRAGTGPDRNRNRTERRRRAGTGPRGDVDTLRRGSAGCRSEPDRSGSEPERSAEPSRIAIYKVAGPAGLPQLWFA